MSEQGERTARALERFEHVLRDSGHPLAAALQPGLSRDAITNTVEPTGLALPDEATELWRWHNGVDPAFTADLTRIPGSEALPGGALLYSLDRAVDEYQQARDRPAAQHRTDLSAAWFPVADYGNALLWVDCGYAPASPAPLIYWYVADFNTPEELARQRVPSVARGIEVLAALIERGIWQVVGPGDRVTWRGVTSVLREDFRPSYAFIRDPDSDLPAHWPVP